MDPQTKTYDERCPHRDQKRNTHQPIDVPVFGQRLVERRNRSYEQKHIHFSPKKHHGLVHCVTRHSSRNAFELTIIEIRCPCRCHRTRSELARISNAFLDRAPRKARLPPTSMILHNCPCSLAEPPVVTSNEKGVNNACKRSYAPVSILNGCSSTPNVCIRALRTSAKSI